VVVLSSTLNAVVLAGLAPLLASLLTLAQFSTHTTLNACEPSLVKLEP